MLEKQKRQNWNYFRIFGANKGSFRGVPRCFEGFHFFVVSLRARNGNPAIILLAISKTDEVDFLRFSTATGGG